MYMPRVKVKKNVGIHGVVVKMLSRRKRSSRRLSVGGWGRAGVEAVL